MCQPPRSSTSSYPPPSPTFHWNCKEDQNKERDLFFTLLSLRSNDITSAASSPQIPDAQHIFPFCREPSILFEFLHFIPTSTSRVCGCQVIFPWKRHSRRSVFQSTLFRTPTGNQEAADLTDGCVDIIPELPKQYLSSNPRRPNLRLKIAAKTGYIWLCWSFSASTAPCVGSFPVRTWAAATCTLPCTSCRFSRDNCLASH